MITEQTTRCPFRVIGVPRVVGQIQSKCEGCGCGTLTKVEVHLEVPNSTLPTSGFDVGIGTFLGCAACGYRSALTTRV